MRAWLVATLIAVPAVASAEVQFSAPGPDGLTIEGDWSTVYVRDGHLRAPLVQAHGDGADRTAHGVTIHTTTNLCGAESDEVFTVDQLRARLANVRGYHAHKRGLYQAAAVELAHAVELDPAFRTAATNLASAQVVMGRRRAAIATLAAWLRTEPERTYIKVATDPELVPLLAEPELAALEVHDQIDPVGDPLTIEVALAVDRHLLARGNHGPSMAGVGFTPTPAIGTTENGSISLFDTDTGALVLELPLATDDDVARASRLLFGLGFTPVALVNGKVRVLDASYIIEGKSDELRQGHRVDLGDVGLVERSGVVRAFHHDTQLGELLAFGHFQDASYVPAAHLVFVDSVSSCADAETAHEQVLLLKNPASRRPASSP